MAGIFTRIDDAISSIIKRFKGKKSSDEVTIPHEIDHHRKAIELAQDFGFLTEDQTGLIMTARDIARGLGNSEIMGVPEGQAGEALKMLYAAIEGSGPVFGRKNAEKAGLALGMALAATLNAKADKRLHEAKDYAEKAEELKAAGKNPETAEEYMRKAEEAVRKAEGFRSTAYWYLGTTPGSDSVHQNKYNKNAAGPKYLRKMIAENKQFFLSMVNSIGQGAKPDLGDLLGMSGFLSSDPAIGASIADNIFAVKSALRVEGIVSHLPEKVEDFKTFVSASTRPIEKITPGKFGDKPVQEMAEALRDLMSARLNQLGEGEMDESRYAEIRENSSLLKKAVWSVVLGNMSASPAAQDTRMAMMGALLAKQYVNDLMPPEEAVKVINDVSMKMSVGLLMGKLESDEAFKNAKDAKEVEQAILAAEERALKANDESITKIFALTENARIESKELIAAVVEAKLGKKAEAPVKEKEAEGVTTQVEAEAALQADAEKKKKGQQEVQDELGETKKKGGKEELLSELPAEVQKLAEITAANENLVVTK